MRSNIFKILALNAIIVLVAVVCYSDGLLALRPWDESIFRAGMSIFIALAELVAFGYGNHLLLSAAPSRRLYAAGELTDISDAREALRSFHGGKYFGNLADTAGDQLGRLERTMDRADRAIRTRFEGGSMAYDRYIATVGAAREAALGNCIGMANRMQLFDEKEYAKLQSRKEAGIPDDIREKQLELYRRNMEQIKSSVAANEKLILALDMMSLELAAPKEEAEGDAQEAQLLGEIQKLTEQVRLYS